MKTVKLTMLATFAFSLFGLLSCTRDVNDQSFLNNQATEEVVFSASNSESCNPYAYNFMLESRTQVDNNWEWVWSVQNTNPGNGNNGTAQDLSHWGMQMGICFNSDHLVAAAYSYDGVNWTSFNPSIGVDPSQDCLTSPVLKFDAGTSGAAKTYYRLTISQYYAMGTANGYYKSGRRTGCCTFSFFGIGCGGGVEERPAEE